MLLISLFILLYVLLDVNAIGMRKLVLKYPVLRIF